MGKYPIQPISHFLTERKERLKPDEANALNIKRIEKIDFTGQIHLADNKPTKTGMIIIKKGDLVISGINVAKGALAVYDGDEDVMATIHYSAYSFDTKKIDIEFLKWFVKSPAFVNALLEQTGGGIKTEIKAKKFLALKIPMPPIDEQRLIEAKLNGFEAKYRKTDSELQTQSYLIAKLRSSILSDAVSGRLVPQDPTDEPAGILLKRIKAEKEKLVKEGKIKKQKPLPPVAEEKTPYELPKGWVWCRLGELCNNITSGSTPPKIHFTDSQEIPYLKVYNIVNQKIDFEYRPQYVKQEIHETKLKRSVLKPGDVVMNIVGPPLGKTAIIPDTHAEWNCNQAIAVFRLIVKELNQYIYTYLCEGSFLKQISLIGTAGQDNISITKSNNLLIPLPPVAEQHRIVAKVEKLMATCDKLETEVQKSRTETDRLMQAILKEAFANEKESQAEAKAPKPFQRSVLAAYFIDNSQDDPYFGHVKLQKMLFMSEALNNLDFNSDYKRHAMGPYDPKLIRSVDAQLKKAKWFEVKQSKGEKGRYVYHPMSKAEEYKKYLGRYWDQSKIEKIFELMHPMKTQQAEIVATLYSAWMDLSKTHASVSDEMLIDEARNNWHDNKKKISVETWQKAIEWMRGKNILS